MSVFADLTYHRLYACIGLVLCTVGRRRVDQGRRAIG